MNKNLRIFACSVLVAFNIMFVFAGFQSNASETYVIDEIISVYQKRIALEEKLSIAELQKSFPEVLEVSIEGSDDNKSIEVEWICTKDYENSTEEEYVFSLKLPENYKLKAAEKSDYNISVMLAKDTEQENVQQQSDTTEEQGLEGDGTEENPYKLYTARDFEYISSNMSAVYEIQNDIDVGGKGWTSIGSSSNPFQGILNGKGYGIKGIKYDKTGAFQGIFVETREASITNLTVETAVDYVSGQSTEQYVGGIVRTGSGTIKNCTVRATLYGRYNSSGKYVNIGLLAGKFTGTIEECYGEGKIITSDSAPRGGSLVGSFSGTMLNSYANVSLGLANSSNYRGGIVGIAHGNIVMRNCYLNSSGSGKSAFVGEKDKNSVTVENCYYNANRFSSENEQETGNTYAQMRKEANYAGFDFQEIWEINSDKNNGYPQLIGKGNNEDTWERFNPHIRTVTDDSEKYPLRSLGVGACIVEKNEKIFIEFDCGIKIKNPKGIRILNFDISEEKETKTEVIDGYKLSITPKSGWDEKVSRYNIIIDSDAICENHGQESIFSGLDSSDRYEFSTLNQFYEGKGTEDDPYLVRTPYQLSCVRYRYADYYELENDLDLSAYNSGQWTGIGYITASGDMPVEFSGVFDGKNYIIQGISTMKAVTPASGANNASGLFAYTKNAVIKNLGIDLDTVKAEYKDKSSQSHGLLVGKGSGTIENCFARGKMENEKGGENVYLGLLAGYFSGDIRQCFAEGSLNGKATSLSGYGALAGGLVGNGSGMIADSYCNVDLSVKSSTGGCVGGIFGGVKGSDISIINCYYHGEIVKDMPGPGGAILANSANPYVRGSYYDNTILDMKGNDYGTGKTAEEMKKSETYENWDFETTWDMDGKTNDGFPHLRWFSYEYEKVGLPVASQKGDVYQKKISVELSIEEKDTIDKDKVKIYYTTDGTKPGKENGSLYTKGIPIGHYTKLQAIAVCEGMRDSNIMEEEYFFQIMPLTGVKLLDDLNIAVKDDGVLRFFPGNLSLKSTYIPVTLEQTTDDDGTYNMKLVIGFFDGDWVYKEGEWKQFKKAVEDSKKSMHKYARMESILHAFGGESISCFDVKEFNRFPKAVVTGYYELTVDKNGYIVKNRGLVTGDLKWSGSVNKHFYTPIGPMYLTLAADGSLKGEMGLKNEMEDNDYLTSKIGLTGGVTTGLSASVEGGYGIAKAATIGAKGKGGFSVKIAPLSKVDFKASASVHLYVAFVLDTTYDLATYEKTLWEKDSLTKEAGAGGGIRNSRKSLSANNMLLQLHPVDRSYAEYTSAWKGNASKKRKAVSSINDVSSDSNEMILQSGVMPNTLPMIQQAGEDSVIVFQANDAKRATLDSSVLMYSVYHDGTWSEPSPVWDTGTCDMYTDLQVVNGELYAVWQKENSKISASSEDINNILLEMAEKSEICFAKYNQETKQFENAQYITSNNKVDMLPKLAYSEGKISAVWMRNSENSLMQDTGTNSIMYSELENGVFGSEKLLCETGGTIEEYTPFYRERGLNVGYVSKVSNDSETNQVYLAGQDGKSNTVSEGTALITNIQYMDNTLYYWEDGIMQTYDVISGSRGAIIAGESAIASNGKIYKTEGKTAVIWSMPNQQEGTSNVYSSVLTEEGFSEPVVLYTTDASINHLDGVLKEDKSWQLIMNTAKEDGANDIHSIVFSTKGETPEIQLETIIVDDAVKEGEETPISYIVTNTSEETIHELELVINGMTRMSTRMVIPVTIAPGETIYDTCNLDLSDFSDTAETQITLNAVGQSSPENVTTKMLVQTDLQVDTVVTETDEEISIVANVSNNSAIPANATLSLYQDIERKELLKAVQLGEVTNAKDCMHTFVLKKADLKKNKNNAYYLPLVVTSDKTDNDEDNNETICIVYSSDDGKEEGDKHKTHNYKEYITKATVTRDGSIVKKCTVCGEAASVIPIYYPKEIRLAESDFTYNGKSLKPSVIVKGSDGKIISASNYTVSYSAGCKKIGHYKVTITFRGNYNGTVTRTFNINPKGTKLSKVKAAKKKVIVKWKKQKKNTKGYQIQYSTSKDFGNEAKLKTVKGNKKTSFTLKGLKSKKTYYMRIRTYQNASGGKCYSAWSKVKKVKVK